MNSSKFDRQLILWGEQGQHRIDNSSVCLVGNDLLTCEIAKGLLLTNCSKICVIDSIIEQKSPLSENSSSSKENSHPNFYEALHPNPKGLSKTQIIVQVLQSFNEGAKIYCKEESLESIIEHDSSFFAQFSLVITANQWRYRSFMDQQLPTEVRCIHAYTNGFHGLMRNNAFNSKGFLVLNAKNDENDVEFFRNSQFPILLEYSKKLLDRIETMQPDEIAQLPYPIFILGNLSETQSAIKAALIDLHSKYQTENLQEAQRKLTRFTSVSSHLIPSNVVELIASKGELKGETESPLIECLSKFIERYKRMPAIPSLLPDIECNTDFYNEISACFSTQFELDFSFFKHHLQNSGINDLEIKQFIKQAPFMHYIKPIGPFPSSTLKSIDPFVGLFETTERFVQTYKRLPGIDIDLLPVDLVHLKMILSGESLEVPEETVNSWIEYGNVQLATTTTTLGAIVCQEAIKIISRVFIPHSSHFLLVDLSDGITVKTA